MVKNKFKVGVNFDIDLLKEIIKLNEEFEDSKVEELYGSIMLDAKFAARPDFRLPNVQYDQLREYVKIANDNGIKFNYTLNSLLPFGSKVELCKNKEKVATLVNFLESIGVYRITVANPILLEIIRNFVKSDIEIEISTCAHIDTVTQIKYYHEKYGVNKVCGNLNKNRDFKFLESAANYCNKNGIIYELMANEFCGVGGSDYTTHCVYRDSCYLCHATNKTYEDSMLLDNYPMNICTNSRNENPSNWLKLRWIRPEDLSVYNNIGLNYFKITGRTGSSEYIIKTIRSYMEQKFDGNLLNLWKPLESIKPGTKESEIKTLFIDNNLLDGFIDYWAKNKHNCDYVICGETCKYCNDYYEKIKEK